MLKSLTTRTSPFLWTPLKGEPEPDMPVPSVVTLFWKNQNPFCASPLLSNRSMPKNTTLQIEVVDGQVLVFASRLYLAAKPFRRASLPGRPPIPVVQPQLEMSIGSLEPPPVKAVPLATVWLPNATAVAPLVLNVVLQLAPR